MLVSFTKKDIWGNILKVKYSFFRDPLERLCNYAFPTLTYKIS